MLGKEEFIKEVKIICKNVIQKSNRYLKPFGLTISINWKYNFSGYYSDAIGVYEYDSVLSGKISIGCNLNVLYECFCQEVESYPFTSEYKILDEMISTNIYHEMGHGIVQLISDNICEYDETVPENNVLELLYDANQDLFDYVLDNEEDAVEKFAWEMYDGTCDCELCKLITLYTHYVNKNNTTTLSENQLKEIIKESIRKTLRNF